MAKKAKKSTVITGSVKAPVPKAAKTSSGPLPPAYKPPLPVGADQPISNQAPVGWKPGDPQTTTTPPPISKDTDLNQVPLTPGDIATIGQIQSQYNTAQSSANQGLYQAAMAYGDQSLINQYGQNAGIGEGGWVVNPNSALPSIQRAQTEAKENTGKSLNSRNTFFSGLHLDALNKINDQASRDTADAYLQFKAAEQRYLDAKAAAEAELLTGTNKIKGSRLDQILADMLKGS